jgi:hypothetical protein
MEALLRIELTFPQTRFLAFTGTVAQLPGGVHTGGLELQRQASESWWCVSPSKPPPVAMSGLVRTMDLAQEEKGAHGGAMPSKADDLRSGAQSIRVRVVRLPSTGHRRKRCLRVGGLSPSNAAQKLGARIVASASRQLGRLNRRSAPVTA